MLALHNSYDCEKASLKESYRCKSRRRIWSKNLLRKTQASHLPHACVVYELTTAETNSFAPRNDFRRSCVSKQACMRKLKRLGRWELTPFRPRKSRRSDEGEKGETHGNYSARNWITHNWPGEFKIYFRWCVISPLSPLEKQPLVQPLVTFQADDGNPISVIRVHHCLGRYAGWLGTCADFREFRAREILESRRTFFSRNWSVFRD